MSIGSQVGRNKRAKKPAGGERWLETAVLKTVRWSGVHLLLETSAAGVRKAKGLVRHIVQNF